MVMIEIAQAYWSPAINNNETHWLYFDQIDRCKALQ